MAMLMILLGAALLWGHEPIGLRLNNPGNLNGIQWHQWQGAAGTDRQYLRFCTPYDGLVAMRRVLCAYQEKYCIDTVSEICDRWVRFPRGRRQRRAFRSYVLVVSKRSGYAPNRILCLTCPLTDFYLERAIVYAEQGSDPYPESLYWQAVNH